VTFSPGKGNDDTTAYYASGDVIEPPATPTDNDGVAPVCAFEGWYAKGAPSWDSKTTFSTTAPKVPATDAPITYHGRWGYTLDIDTIVVAGLAAPRIGGVPSGQANVKGKGYTIDALSWSPADTRFKADTSYNAAIALKAKDDASSDDIVHYRFAALGGLTASADGLDASISSVSADGASAHITCSFGKAENTTVSVTRNGDVWAQGTPKLYLVSQGGTLQDAIAMEDYSSSGTYGAYVGPGTYSLYEGTDSSDAADTGRSIVVGTGTGLTTASLHYLDVVVHPGAGEGTYILDDPVLIGSKMTLPAAPAAPANKVFEGWYTDAALTSFAGKPGASYTVTAPAGTEGLGLYGAWGNREAEEPVAKVPDGAYPAPVGSIDLSTADAQGRMAVALDKTGYTYNGKAVIPALPTVSYDKVRLTADLDYTISESYKDNNTLGKATATYTITGKDGSAFKGSYSPGPLTFTITLATPKISVKGAHKALKVTLKSAIKGAKAYTVYYSTHKGAYKKVVLKAKGKVLTLKGLKAHKAYYVKVAACVPTSYKTVLSKTLKAKAGKLTFSWKASAQATGYRIAYRLKGTHKWSYKGVGIKTVRYVLTHMRSGKAYQVKVSYKTKGYKSATCKVVKAKSK
jgi:hypothetical protein